MSGALIPEKGEQETTIIRLIEYLTNYFPDFSSNIKGASKKLISTYSNFSKYQLPIVYVHYLQVMGLNNNDLFQEITSFNLIDIIDFYEDITVSEPETLKMELPIIGLYDIGDEISFDLTENTANPKVVYSASGDLIQVLSSSFEYYLMKYAYKYVERRKKLNGGWFSSTPNNANKHIPLRNHKQSLQNELSLLAKKNGLTEVWFSDKKTRIYANEKISLFAETGSNERKNSVLITIFYDKTISLALSEYIDKTFGTTGLTNITMVNKM